MTIICNKYQLLEKIGEGSFGTIYKGENIRTKELVAIKIEPIKNNTKLLKNESIIYQYLNNNMFATIKWFGKDSNNYYMIINLLGESLESFKERKGTFSLKLILQIGIQVIILLKEIHNKGLIHRDIKPDNFLFGLNSKNKQIYIIDFGFCKTFLNDNNTHIEFKKTNNLIGTSNFASVNAHNFNELSRRDDLESLGYMLIYFYFGNLTWQDCSNNEIIKNMKNNITNNKDIPKILIYYFEIIKKIEFKEMPNYELIIDMFKNEI